MNKQSECDVILADKELLNFAVKNGMIDIANIQQAKTMYDKERRLKNHKYSVWQGKNGLWYTYIPDDTKKRGMKLLKRKTKQAVLDCIDRYWADVEMCPTIEQLFNDWNNLRLEKEQISPASHLKYQQVFNRHFEGWKTRRLNEIKPCELVEFLEDSISQNHLKPKSWRDLRCVTKKFIKYAKRKGFTDINIDEVLEDVSVAKRCFDNSKKEQEDEVFTEDEFPVIIRELEKNLDAKNTALLLMFVTGLRSGECTTLKWADIHADYISVCRTETRYVKEGKYIYTVKESPKTEAGKRKVVIPEGFYELLKNLKNNNSEWVFVRQDGSRVKASDLYDRLAIICKRCGVKFKSPHKIRKTYASILIDSGIDASFIIQQLGHTTIDTTEFYYYRNRKNLEKKKNLINGIKEFQKVTLFE